MDNETTYTVNDLLAFAHEQKPLDFETTFKSIMADKMVAAIDAKKVEIASSLYSSSDEVDNEEETDEAEEVENESEEQEETPEEETDGETA
jgi:hypothetical protein